MAVGEYQLIFFAIIFVMLLAWPIAAKVNKFDKEKNPEKTPYYWGVFQGVFFIVLTVLAAILMGVTYILAPEQMMSDDLLFQAGVTVVFLPLGYFTVKRNKWAFTLLTLFSANIILWFTNAFYIKKRWKELS